MKNYTIKATWDIDKGFSIERECDGFNALEILGILHLSINEVMTQIEERTNPDKIVRNIIIREKGKTSPNKSLKRSGKKTPPA